MITIDTIKKTNKVLGRGMNGTVYLVKDNKNNKYALKIQQIMPEDVKESLSSQTWREIYCASILGKKYPKHFMKLYDYQIDEKCKHKQSWKGFGFELKDLPKNQQNFYKKLFSSPYCSIKLWSFIDLTLKDLIESWKVFHYDIFYDLLIQVIYTICLMQKEGFYHRDFHPGNIGLVKTKEKYIDINGKKIKTHGYLVQAIDFELNLHKKYKLKKWEKNLLENDNDLYAILFSGLWDFSDLKKYYKKVKIDEYKHDFKIAKEDEELLSCCLKDIKLSKENYNLLIHLLYKLVFYEKWEKDILGNKFTKAIPPKLYVPMNVLLYMIQHINETEKILKYLIKNR